MLLLGNFLLIATFGLLAYCLVATVLGLRSRDTRWWESAIRAVYAATATVIASSVILTIALISRDFRFEYVARHVSSTLPLAYCATAFWAGQAGSLLFWLLVLLVFVAVSLRLYHRSHGEVIPYFILFAGGSALFFNLLLLMFTNPFAPANPVPPDGLGMNPLLQNVMMVFHPPTLFLGYVGFTIPFAFALGSLLAGRFALDWITIVRKWTLVSWIFLTVGIILGMQWAYVELGWGGYWGWDPVENASFIPWLAATALLHTVILQEQKGLFKKWNVFLVVLTFLLCIFGTFITRSGFIESVHAFALSDIGYYFLAFMLLVLVLCLIILYRSRKKLTGQNHLIRLDAADWSLLQWLLFLVAFYIVLLQIRTYYARAAEYSVILLLIGILVWKRSAAASLGRKLLRLLSREGMFILTNFIFMFFLLFVFWGTVYPTLHEGLMELYAGFSGGFRESVAQSLPGLHEFFQRKLAVSPAFFNKWVMPFALVLLFMMVFCPLFGWRKLNRKVIYFLLAVLLVLVPLAIYTGLGVGAVSWMSVVLFGLTGFAIIAIVSDVFSAVAIRRRLAGESWLRGAANLFRKNKRRYGGYLSHIGVLILIIGIIGSSFYTQEYESEVNIGETFIAGEWELKYVDLQFSQDPEKSMYQAILEVIRNGRTVGRITPEKHLHRKFEQPMTEVSIDFNLLRDLYVIFSPVNRAGRAYFKILVNPLVIWIWVGGLLITLGGIYAILPNRRRLVLSELAAKEEHHA
ncbi:MAG: heme lyase CcmF/NrfE family subunit [Acidobacteria bacterium]|nr:heme lyase CcmF/NrfE family subunit [Acidobacteriota bacterium]